MRRRPWVAPRLAVVAAIATTLAAASGLAAQDLASSPGDGPEWTRAWSPLLWTAELPRALPSAQATLPDPVLWPAPRVGLFWTAGNPAALPADVTDKFSVFRATSGRERGSYRRPLDPASISDAGVSAEAWRPFGSGGAAIGSVQVDKGTLGGDLSDYDLSYPGSPYVVMDTAASALGQSQATLDGALGWRSGAWAVGVGVGYRAESSRTVAAPVPRILSAADPGASVGVVWNPSPAFSLGLHGRWRAHAERILLYSVAAASLVYPLQGYFNVQPQGIAGGYYEERMDRNGFAGGLEAGGVKGAIAWTTFLERGSQDESQFPLGQANPIKNTWTSDAWTWGGAARRGSDERGTELALSVRYTTLSGHAGRGDLPDTTTFVSDESVFDGVADASVELSDAVRLALRGTMRREHRTRTDQLARVGSDLQGWTSGIGAGVSVRATNRLQLGAGGAFDQYGGGGSLPDPSSMGPVYATYVAPALLLTASDARATAVGASLLWRGLPTGAVWVRGRYYALNPSSGAVNVPGLPTGNRTSWSVDVGVVLGR